MSNITTTGRRAAEAELELLGAIEPSDLVARAEGVCSEVPTLNKIRAIHHDIAKMLAQGMKPSYISSVLNYSLSRISTLQRDPAFKELVTYYNKGNEVAFADVRKQIATLSSDAVAELSARLEEQSDSISTANLLEIAKLSLDRSGFAPVAKSQVAIAHISADDIKDLKAQAGGENVTILKHLQED